MLFPSKTPNDRPRWAVSNRNCGGIIYNGVDFDGKSTTRAPHASCWRDVRGGVILQAPVLGRVQPDINPEASDNKQLPQTISKKKLDDVLSVIFNTTLDVTRKRKALRTTVFRGRKERFNRGLRCQRKGGLFVQGHVS